MTLELISIRKKLGEFRLKDVSLSVSSGEYFVILGPSGVGKTVLLETIAGLTKPDSGRITWKGRDITCTAPEMRRFALVYQDYALFPHRFGAGRLSAPRLRGRLRFRRSFCFSTSRFPPST